MANLSKDNKDILRLLSSNSHIGTKNLSHQMKPYVESKTSEGIHLINPKLTLEKIKLAARVIVTIEKPEDIIVKYILLQMIYNYLYKRKNHKYFNFLTLIQIIKKFWHEF